MDSIKTTVREKYAEIALQDKATNETSCCGVGCCEHMPKSPTAKPPNAVMSQTQNRKSKLGK